MKQKRSLIEVSFPVHNRLKKVAKKEASSVKTVVSAFLEKSLDEFESGKIALTKVTAQEP